MKTLKQRFEEKTQPEPNTGCLLWTGGTNTNGYGQMNVKRPDGWRRVLAHRLVWEWSKGKPPTDVQVCHRCDTPLCVNVDHLFLGTNQDNVNDRVKKGRTKLPGLKGEAQAAAKLTESVVREIRRDGVSCTLQELANRYGVSGTTIWYVLSGKTWRHVS